MVPYDCGTNVPADGGQCRGPYGIDQVVLTQRADFVRPDSLLAVVMLSDEDDCSVVDGAQNYIAAQAYSGQNPWHLPRATSQCQTDPNSAQCMSCAQGDFSSDPECSKGLWYSDAEDALNLRCYRQKQRFGLDFLYPVRRYINALTKSQFSAADTAVNYGFLPDKDFNPVFCTKYAEVGGTVDRSKCLTVLRDPSLVFLSAIVGVPWQDIAMDPNDLKKGYRPVSQLSWKRSQFQAAQLSVPPGVTEETTVWDQVLGKVLDANSADPMGIDFSPAGEPQDPLMIESIDQRSGTNPATGYPLADKNAGSPMANPINGHEWDISGRNDLQYACTFKLPDAKDCAMNTTSCDCSEADGLHNPLCQSDSGAYGKMQYRAKGYPGRRQLAVLHGLSGDQAIASSICPANMTDQNASDYGYRPAVAAIVERLKAKLAATCWSKQLAYNTDNTVSCVVLEASKYPEGTTVCPSCNNIPSRAAPDADAMNTLQQDPMYVENDLKCACEIAQAAVGAPLQACIESTSDPVLVNGSQVNGWCYVDPSQHPTANSQLVLTCPADMKRTIRFVGDGHPQAGSLTFIQCKN